MAREMGAAALRDLLVTTKDGDWGKDSPAEGLVPYRVIRGTDFPSVRLGNTSSVPIRYLSDSTVHRRTLAADDILLETAGGSPDRPTGRSLLINQRLLASLELPATCASFARFLRVDRNKAEPQYVYWFLQYLYASGQMAEHQVQHTGVARFQYTKFAESQEISLPDRDEQRAIAHILGTLDDKIELNRRMSETLEAMAQALFKSWFVDFDPVRAKAEGRDPGLPQPLADLFPARLVDSELGEIPEGWRPSQLGNEVLTVLGGTPSRAEPAYWGGDIPWINSGKANEFRVVEPSEFITLEGLASSATRRLPSRTTVIAITGATLGQISLAEIETCANQSIVGVLGTAALPSEFIYFWTKEHVEDLRAWQTGGAQQHINKNNVNDLPVLCPSESVIAAYLAVACPAFDRIKACCNESRTLAALRDTLLPNLISGKLRVSHAKGILGGVDA